jgi:hypothetical protein
VERELDNELSFHIEQLVSKYSFSKSRDLAFIALIQVVQHRLRQCSNRRVASAGTHGSVTSEFRVGVRTGRYEWYISSFTHGY